MNRISPSVAGLLIVNIALFAAGQIVPAWRNQIVELGALWFPTNEHFGWWQMVSYMFLHANFSHILFNMFALVSFGTILEHQWGAARFLFFYFLCGLGAGLIQTGINWYEFGGLHDHLLAAGMTPSAIETALATGSDSTVSIPAVRAQLNELYLIYAAPMLGASGAIYGVLVAFGMLFPNAKLALMFVPIPVAAKIVIPILLGIDLLSGVTGFSIFGAGIAHFAHLGGAAIGFLLMLMWRNHHGPDEPSGQINHGLHG